MFATFPRTRNQRRGVVLILVLGMLGLLALIGVTFATFSGQVKINSRNFSQAQNWPESSELMDYALAQLIDDTDNPMSAIRGHSIKRDMYGNDAFYNSALTFNPGDGLPFTITGLGQVTTAGTTVNVTEVDGSSQTILVTGLVRVVTSIAPNTPALYGYNFTRWVMRFPAIQAAGTPPAFYVSETHEILADVIEGTERVFYVAPWDNFPATPAGGMPAPPNPPLLTEMPPAYSQAPTIPYPLPSTFPGTSYQANPPAAPALQYYNFYNTTATTPGQSTLIGLTWRLANVGTYADAPKFTLDGRFLHAFNGPGMDGVFASASRYANFRVNGNVLNGNAFLPPATRNLNPAYGNPNTIGGMDEDYDACDLENWFLALQSGDGQVMIPSFHRPGILVNDANFSDWTSLNNTSASKILRPRRVDNHNGLAFPDLTPDPVTGKITYDVDNDGDGTTDSVWLDLGYPARRNTDGRFFKPLYAFMVIGLNGRIPLNTAGNLQLRDLRPDWTGTPPYPFGKPLMSHASGKGDSPSQVDPLYALQNAFDRNSQLYSPVDNAGSGSGGTLSGGGVFTPGDNTGPAGYTFSPWWGTAGIPVNETQLRNILAGTRSPGLVKNAAGVELPTTDDANFVVVDGKPMYVPNGVLDAGDANNPAATTTEAISGRWGEPSDQPVMLDSAPLGALTAGPDWPPLSPQYTYLNQVRAGLSGQWTMVGTVLTPRYGDARDDNYNSFDWYPFDSSVAPPITPESGDFFDASGSLALAVERLRRFVTPIDVMGDGLVNSMMEPFGIPPGPYPTASAPTVLYGADRRGRVAYVKHFRPAGLAMATPPGLALPAAPLPLTPPGTPTDAIWYPYETNSRWLRSIGFPVPPTNDNVPAGTTLVPVDLTNNLYHGFESYRMPITQWAPTPPPPPPVLMLASTPNPIQQPNTATPPAPHTPTFDNLVNSNSATLSPLQPLANLNEADEMQLYKPQPYDQPFGPSDLEWLYRLQDVDGVSLDSRLKDLAPVSFTNSLDGQRRRRLFSVETWDPTTFVWANDNPVNDAEWRVVTATNAPFGNSRFYATDNTGNGLPTATSSFSANLSTQGYLVSQEADVYDPTITTPPTFTTPQRTPSVAHRNRKINLNFPLPVSNRYDEPVRQKWIRETYQLLKQVLPPKAVDTPEELVQLSQFVVNIIDFRDPDATATRFVNTDVYYDVAATATTPAHLNFTPPGGVDPATLLGAPWRTGAAAPPPPYSLLYDNKNSPYVVQYGMEYNPIALNEVLAFSAIHSGAATGAGRMWVELVNTLTRPATAPDASDFKLDGWDFVILPDNPTGRPDPYTGQLPMTSLPGAAVPPPNVKGVTLSDRDITTLPTAPFVDPRGLSNAVDALAPGTAVPDLDETDDQKYYTIQSTAFPVENGEPDGSPDATIDLIGKTVLSDTVNFPPDRYYWLYLRRPANPFDTTYDATRANENRVVVDCFRFMYKKAAPTTTSDGGTMYDTAPNAGDIYSTQRFQPYRGGHFVPPIPALPTPSFYGIPNYGYTEQTMPALVADDSESGDDYQVLYDTGKNTSTGTIHNSIGHKGEFEETWDFLPFNDRDFTSIAELLMVPGCPPGLFTKQFVEVSGPITTATEPLVNPPALAALPPFPTRFSKATTAIGNGNATTPPNTSQPHTFPYLVDKFFYTAQSEPMEFMATTATVPTAGEIVWPDRAAGPAPIRQPSNYNPTFPVTKVNTALATHPTYIDGPSSAGWFRMFDFFDVPSPASGSIGTVAEGTNYDWARQDLKPGLLNINLIIDEEVFFSVMSESWLKTLNFARQMTTAPFSPGQDDINNMGATRLNVAQLPSTANTPVVVTQVDSNGTPNASYPMPNVGFMALDPLASAGPPATGPVYDNRMKAAFSDFLKLRHGGSGFMFAHQMGKVGDPNTTLAPGTTVVAAERPYRSLSYPNVNYTVLRPAALPPSASTVLTPYLPSWNQYTGKVAFDNAPSPYFTYIGDPGVKNPYLFTTNNPVQPPPIPPRRLFQLPDVWGNVNFPFPVGGTPLRDNASNGLTQHNATTIFFTGDPNINWQNLNNNLSHNVSDISATPTITTTTGPPYVIMPNFYLGANTSTAPLPEKTDTRQHPYFRSEWLHKVTNLTTVRTHQYAVWITVGFFEVTKQGDSTLGNTAPDLAYDQLGQELNIQSGTNIRYRSFFVIDRTRAVGFSPQAPGNFRECIVYRQPIE